MSKKNIIDTVHLPNGKTHVTFQTDNGIMKYEFSGNSAKALKHGTDPSDLHGRLIEHKKKEKQQ
jgi:hypothetical protein